MPRFIICSTCSLSGLFALPLLIILPSLFFPVYANDSPIFPTSKSKTYQIKFDRSTASAQINNQNAFIWNTAEIAAYDPEGSASWLKAGLVCQSATDPSYGACSTQLSPESNQTSSTIKLALTNQYQQKLTISLDASKVFCQPAAGRCVITGGAYAINSASEPDSRQSGGGYAFGIGLGSGSDGVKSLLPGIWQGQIKMKLMQSPDLHLADWTATLTLHVTDTYNKQIYLPLFPSNSGASVDLQIKNISANSAGITASGTASMDTCLYDGDSSSSSRMQLLLTDEGLANNPTRAPGNFSIYATNGNKSERRNRLDYEVYITNPLTGAADRVQNGIAFSWQSNHFQRHARQVTLGNGESVWCIPAPIVLVTPKFPINEKAAGAYRGRLTITYTPAT